MRASDLFQSLPVALGRLFGNPISLSLGWLIVHDRGDLEVFAALQADAKVLPFLGDEPFIREERELKQ